MLLNKKFYNATLQDNYDWGDVFDQTVTIKKQTPAFSLPNTSSTVRKIYYPGDQFQIYSYVNRDGVTWLMFYANDNDWNNFKSSWIPLVGTPADVNTVPTSTIDSLINAPGDILTTEQKAQLQAIENQTVWDKVITAGKYVAGIGLGLVVLNKVLR